MRVKISIRILFVLIALTAIPLAWVSNQARIGIRETETLESFGDSFAAVYYDYQNEMGEGQPNGPIWLRQIFGQHAFSRVDFLILRNPQPEDLQRLVAFEELLILEIYNADSLENLEAMPRHESLAWLDLSGGNLKSLGGIESLKNLGTLKVNIDDLEDVTAINKLEQLHYLTFRGCDIESLSSLAGMKELRTVFLHGLSKLNDLEALVTLPKIKTVNGSNLDLVTTEMIESLRARLPGAQVFEK
jgi:hypothetical protein